MSLLVLMYHRARADVHGNPPEVLDLHLNHVASCYPNVMPGESLAEGTPNVCLTFDDGYFDFYANVFPLLKKYRLRALLAIPPLVIKERVDAEKGSRIAVATKDAFAHPSRGGFCTWPELEEMASSGHVTMAAHGFTHRGLDGKNADLNMEINVPQTVLASRFQQPVESFMFPFGRYSGQSLRQAKQRYRYVFRIGGATNTGWGGRSLLPRGRGPDGKPVVHLRASPADPLPGAIFVEPASMAMRAWPETQ